MTTPTRLQIRVPAPLAGLLADLGDNRSAATKAVLLLALVEYAGHDAADVAQQVGRDALLRVLLSGMHPELRQRFHIVFFGSDAEYTRSTEGVQAEYKRLTAGVHLSRRPSRQRATHYSTGYYPCKPYLCYNDASAGLMEAGRNPAVVHRARWQPQ